MKQFTREFLNALDAEMVNHPKREEIILEYVDYLEQKYKDLLISGVGMERAEELVIKEMPDPQKIAYEFNKKRASVKTTLQTVVVLNYSLFVIGLLITFGFYLNHGTGITLVWHGLVENKWYILFGYSAFWLMVGYLFGAKFGFKGDSLLKKALWISLVPNFILMVLVLSAEKIQGIFGPFITPSFIVMCIAFTFFFYPISRMSYKIGIVRGI